MSPERTKQQIYHLANIKLKELAGLYITQCIIAKLSAVELDDFIAKRGEGTPDLAVTAFTHDDLP